MLSEYQQKIVWDNLLGAEIRAAYFAELSGRYLRYQRMLLLGSLLLASGAFLSLVTTIIPQNLAWIKAGLAFFAAFLSFWSLVAKNEKASIDAADLHFRWNVLAMEYQALWSNVQDEGASTKLTALTQREAELSKSSVSFPDDESLMIKCQDNIVMHHQQELTA